MRDHGTSKHALALALVGCLLLPACTVTITDSEKDRKAAESPVPLSVDAARKLHQPPAVEVQVDTQVSEGGGGVCAHHPACLLVLLGGGESVRGHDVTIERDGKLWFKGRYRDTSALQTGRLLEPGRARDFYLLPLRALRRDELVEVARSPLNAAGEAGEAQLLPWRQQFDPLPLYIETWKQVEPGDVTRRRYLIEEAFRYLGADAAELLAVVLEDQAPPPYLRTQAVDLLCQGKHKRLRLHAADRAETYPGRDPRIRQVLLGALQDGSLVDPDNSTDYVNATSNVIACLLDGPSPAVDLAHPLFAQLSRRACGAHGDHARLNLSLWRNPASQVPDFKGDPAAVAALVDNLLADCPKPVPK